MKVHVVEIGMYSDKRVVAVVSDPTTVKLRGSNKIGIDRVTITEFEVDEIETIPESYSVYAVTMSIEDGNCEIYQSNLNSYFERDKYQYTSKLRLYRYVLAEDEDHAAKIVNEERARIKASR